MTPPPHITDAQADWSQWLAFDQAVAAAPRLPGVYMAREGAEGEVVYVGMAGERHGRGLWGRLSVYHRGRGVVSGLGEAAMDRALADIDWLSARLGQLEAGVEWRTRDWAAAAMARADLHMRYALANDRQAAFALESQVLAALADTNL